MYTFLLLIGASDLQFGYHVSRLKFSYRYRLPSSVENENIERLSSSLNVACQAETCSRVC
jgi:hypothetical protein